MPQQRDLPAPPLPATVDLRVFDRMPLDVKRLRDAETVVLTKPLEFKCAVLLWCASWHQLPASSLPDDDALLADLAGFGFAVKEWRKVRAGALRGFVKCSDGRLYHGVIAAIAIESWGSHLLQRFHTECERVRKDCQRRKVQYVKPDPVLWITANVPEALPYLSQWKRWNVPRDTPPESQGQAPHVPAENVPKGREGSLPSTTSSGDGTTSARASAVTTPGPDSPGKSKPRAHGNWRTDPDACMRKLTELGLKSPPGEGLSQAVARIERHLEEQRRHAA